jgi:hypothetical protein
MSNNTRQAEAKRTWVIFSFIHFHTNNETMIFGDVKDLGSTDHLPWHFYFSSR